jgi:ribulose-phosphate 3-epimerase
MGVVPGFQGQPFIEDSLNKVRDIKTKQWPVKVGIDGAVRDTNIKQIVEAGVDYVNIGSFLVKGDPDESLEKLWEAING